MNNLLSIEWLKVKKYRTFWVLIGFFVVLLPAWNYTLNSGIMKFGGGDASNIMTQAYTFDYIWGSLTYWASYFVTFISVLVIIVTTNEYSFRTGRQNIIDGWKREGFYHAKWAVVITLAIFSTLVVFLTGLIFGAASGDISNFPGNIKPLYLFFILAMNYYGFGLLLGLLFKRSGLAIGLFFLYAMFLESMISAITNYITKTSYGNFMPLQASDELLPLPLKDIVKNIAGLPDPPPDWQYIIASCIWIVIYYLIGRMRLLKSDW